MPLSWTSGTYGSAAHLNDVTLHKMTGDEIESLSQSEVTPFMRVGCTVNSTSGDFIAGRRYVLNLAMTAWEQEGLVKHTHTDQDDGGVLADTLLPNIPTTINLDKRWSKSNAFWTTLTSGGTVTDDAAVGRIQLQTLTTSGGAAQISDGGSRKLTFTKPSAFEITIDMTSNTNFTAKCGVSSEDIGVANTNTSKYGIEGCSSSGTNWLIFSANGTLRSTVTTTSPVVTTTKTYRVEHYVGDKVSLFIDGVFIQDKTNEIPATGVTTLNNLYKAGVKNSAVENKILNHYGGPQVVGST